ncbi:1019_t:CDS:2 [Ambispora gerdemannii]|uniref:tRNA-splicing endonuclease subunit Sen2 n=1 Tax=Ambispora gerdemannii TaxID=144530 RepID=A0A9N8Z902_9GLOM|nr:1019_t:CDS:2 [Ambispora gerdemannii]
MNSAKQNHSTPKLKRTLAADTFTQPLPITLSNSQLPSSFLSTIFGYFHNLLSFKSATNKNYPTTIAIGIFDKFSRNVIVENKEQVELLWKSGFFGKGTLSRGDPTWFSRNSGKNHHRKNLFLEEVTKKRHIIDNPKEKDDDDADAKFPHSFNDIEKFQLTLEEAFFLCFGIGSLLIYDTNQKLLSIKDCWDAFRNVAVTHYCYHQPTSMTSFTSSLVQTDINRWDNPFVIRYVTFHYFRSMGWVVRGGEKFGVDFLLYEKGPIFHHGEYAVVILPVYSNPDDDPLKKSTGDSAAQSTLLSSTLFHQNLALSWQWFMSLNRISAQAKKTIVICYVIIPDTKEYSTTELMTSPDCIRYYKVKEVTIKRFIPEQSLNHP